MSEAPNNNSAKRSRALLVLTLGFFLLGLGYGVYWWIHGRHHETTDDAYVAGNLIRVTPRIAGTVVAVYADDTDLVQRGQLLVRLDDADARVALSAAESRLAETVRQVRQMFSAVEQDRANVAIKQESLRQAEADAARRGGAAADEAVSREEREHSGSALKRAQSELRLANSQLEGALAQVAHTDVAHHPAVMQAEAQVREAFLNLGRCEIRAAESGYVAKRAVQVGQQAAPGTALMVVVPLRQVWVEANFKEDQLQRMRIGQAVELQSDLYGSGVTLHGKVAGLGAGTGSVFSLLPPQNASGNWIKIVQRLPVRIVLDPAEVAKHPLRIGLSMKAQVETKDASGESLASVSPSGPRYETAVYGDDEKAAGQRIREIVAANLQQAK
ncbi:multidrug resistance protein A [Sulfurimicrobium lacus]|uniref:Multidrug resistance protein A n=1 Tax=Sulfurimicrobium lacus TaxID=2715678 RepID=A0A6F8VCP3_9PROT|nr:HlyD family secretion protein [Sulfurimicrobium lacus]BCB26509.1 multidrug resistance protein A [Sulfurimicrobium lacus]